MPEPEVVTHLAVVQRQGLVTEQSTESRGFSNLVAAEQWARERIQHLGGARDVRSSFHPVAASNLLAPGAFIVVLTSQVTPVWGIVAPHSMVK